MQPHRNRGRFPSGAPARNVRIALLVIVAIFVLLAATVSGAKGADPTAPPAHPTSAATR